MEVHLITPNYATILTGIILQLLKFLCKLKISKNNVVKEKFIKNFQIRPLTIFAPNFTKKITSKITSKTSLTEEIQHK